MVEIGMREDHHGVYQKEIAKKQLISFKYLDHIISSLKAAGLIINARGKKSGYILTRKPEEISTYDIIKAFEPGICIVDCVSNVFTCEVEDSCATKFFWEGLNNQMIDYLKNYSLKKIIDDQKELNLQK
jgi:Rrf2 family protein